MTVVSNIHLNIAGWSPITYAAGARVSNAGNAYQCTTPGPSTSPPTGTGSGINNGGTAVWAYLSGIDYTTMQAWSNDITRFPAVLTQPIVANPWNSGPPVVATLGTPIVTLSGHTTTSSNTITIRPAAGESFQAAYLAAPTTPYAYNPANGVTFQTPPADQIVTVGAVTNYITPTSGGSLTDASGNIYTITGGQYATENGVLMLDGRNTAAMEYYNGVIYGQDATSGHWFYWTGRNFLVATTNPPAPSYGSFTDAAGNVWTISTAGLVGGQAFENGALPNGQFSANVVKIALIGGIVWLNNAGGSWYSWSGTAWVASLFDPTLHPNALVFAGSGASFTDGSSNVWSISNGGQVLKNGTLPAFSANVAFIALVQDVIWHVNYGGQWYSWSGTAWIATINAPLFIISNCFHIDDNYVTLDGLQFQSPVATTGGAIIGGRGANLTISQCIFDGYAQAVGANPIAVSGANLSVTNSLIVGRNTVAGGAMVSTLGAAGAVIVNDTFVHTSLVTGQPVLDAGANTTTASETSTNNIFYNYAVVYGCAGSGTPWLSSYCAYSAASFSGSNKGTDAGSSIYGLTAAAIFAGFPTNLNPVAGSALISAGFLDTSAIPTGNDAFGNPRPQGSAWDIGAVELLAAISVSVDFVCSIEFAQSLPAIPGLVSAIEWRGPVIVDAVMPVSWVSNITSIGASAVMPLEILHAKTADSNFPAEWGGSVPTTTPVVRDVAISLEWGAAAQSDLAGSIEVLQSMPSLLGPWTQVYGPVFGIGPYTTDPAFPISWTAGTGGVVGTNITVPLDWTAGVWATATAPIEIGALLRRDISAPMEWSAGAAFGVNATFCVEWSGSLNADATAPVAWLATLATPVNIAVALEWRASMAADSTMAMDWRASLRADSVAPVAWTQSVVTGTASIPIEAGQTIVADSMTPVDVLATIRRDMTSPLEWGIRFAPVSFVVPIEWTAGIAGVAASAIEWTSTIASSSTMPLGFGASQAADGQFSAEMLAGAGTSAVLPVEPGGGVGGTAVVPLEFGHLTFTVTVDTTMPLEISSLVVGDIVVPIEIGATRLTIGAALEPDQWEWEHQPERDGELP